MASPPESSPAERLKQLQAEQQAWAKYERPTSLERYDRALVAADEPPKPSRFLEGLTAVSEGLEAVSEAIAPLVELGEQVDELGGNDPEAERILFDMPFAEALPAANRYVAAHRAHRARRTITPHRARRQSCTTRPRSRSRASARTSRGSPDDDSGKSEPPLDGRHFDRIPANMGTTP